MHDRDNKNLYCMSIRQEDPHDDPNQAKKGFEEEFIIAE